MKMRIRLTAFTLLLCGAMATIALADYIDDIDQPAYEQCGNCHELDGNPRMPNYPRLAGQRPAYLIKQLQEFRAGKRTGQMQASAELLSNAEIRMVAQYFTQKPVVQAPLAAQSSPEHQMALQLYRRGNPTKGVAPCSDCHGWYGWGNANIPRLATQQEDYLRDQLMLFKNGQRSNDVGGQMRTIAARLSVPEITALAGYLARLK